MIETTFNVKGFKELDEALKQFPIKLQRNILKSATKEGAKVIQRAAIAMAPVETGQLAKSIKIKIKTKRKQHTVTYIVGLNKKGWYGRLVELGAGAHIIKIKSKKALTIGDKIIGTEIQHPGVIKRKPFMRPAIDNYADQAIAAIKTKLLQGIEKNLPVMADNDDA